MKRKLAFLILLMLFSSFSFGQNEPAFANQIDSIQNLIESSPKESIEEIRLLNELARLHFYDYNIKAGFFATKKALDLSNDIDFEGGRVMYYLTLSVYHGFLNDEMRIYYQKKAEWLSKSFGNQSRNYFEIPEIPDFKIRYDYVQLRNEYLKILPFFEEEGDKEIRANLLFKINIFNFMLDDREKVLEYFDQIDAIYQDLGQAYPKFLNLTYKLLLYNNINDEDAYKEAEIELLNLFLNSKEENILGLIASTIASGYADNGRFSLSVEYYLKSIEEFEKGNDLDMMSRMFYELGIVYENMGMNTKATDSYMKCLNTLETLNSSLDLYTVYSAIIFPLIAIKDYDQAQKYLRLIKHDSLLANNTFHRARYWDAKGQILMSQKKYETAIPYFEKAITAFTKLSSNHWGLPFLNMYISECKFHLGEFTEALSFAKKSLEIADVSDIRIFRNANLLTSTIYEKLGNETEALKHLKKYQKIVEESNRLDEINRIADAEIKAILEKSKREIVELEQEQQLVSQENKIQRLWLISVFGALLSALLVLYFLYRNNRTKQKANAQLLQQKEKVEETLDKLRSTQSQLIQSEKMASLGELTAGIAHEIQNPLNFVNNFAEVSEELAAELKDELNKGEIEEAQEISSDIIENLNKISQHGKRASFIVNGMLEHSRTSSGEKIPTDLKVLAEEYLKLSYHGLRAKDKSFQANFHIEADESLPKVNVVSQDIGRVLLNLINNAFYAVDKKSKLGIENYQPEISVEVKNLEKNIEIRVKDNGSGIPDEIKDKIFQPFFTTKPTGEGTGLGLSLSYDIVTKGHGGELLVESKEGEGTVFILNLPTNPESSNL